MQYRRLFSLQRGFSLAGTLSLLLVGGLFSANLIAGEFEEEAAPQGPASIIKRFVDPLTRRENRPLRSMLTSDEEHANSIGPVLTPGTPVYIRTYQVQQPTRDQQNLILDDGRMFLNYESAYDQTEMPALKIRPVDGKTKIPFLVRSSVKVTASPSGQPAVYLFVRLPAIFSPEFAIKRCYLGGQKLEARVTTGAEDGSFIVFIPLEEVEGKLNAGRSLELIIEGSVALADYQVLSPAEFESSAVFDQPPLKNLARALPGRDYLGPEELAALQPLTDQIRAQAKSQYDQIVAAQKLVCSKLAYFQNNMQRTAMQAVAEGIGDCDDYSRVMVCLLRSLGIPSRMVVGSLYDFNSMGPHAWVEVALMTKRDKPHWFVCDPTLASASPDKEYFVQFRNRVYLYPVRFELKAQNLAAELMNEVLLNWSEKDKLDKLPPMALSAVIHSFDQTLDTSFRDQVAWLENQGLLLPRQFMFTPGASYVLVDHPVTPERSHLRLLLDSEERVVAELTVTDDDYGLESPADLQTVGLLREAYQNLKQAPFEGSEARYCLELSYFRDRYSDRLQRVRLRVSRYLVENQMRTIVNSFKKANLLAEEEAQKVIQLHQTSAGKNLYYLQELARRLGPVTPTQPPPAVTTPPAEVSGSLPPDSDQ